MNENQIVIYKTDDGQTAIDVRMENETVWLTQAQMTELFQKDRSVITRHINNVFAEKELDMKSNVHFLHIPLSDKPVKIYSLDVIISVGYRVKSQRGVQFRQWENRVLKDYQLKGYAVNERIRKSQIGELRHSFTPVRLITGISLSTQNTNGTTSLTPSLLEVCMPTSIRKSPGSR